MRAIVPLQKQRTYWWLMLVSILVVAAGVACSPTPLHRGTPLSVTAASTIPDCQDDCLATRTSPLITSMPVTISSSTPYPACDSVELLVPTSVVATGKHIDYLTARPASTPWPSGLTVSLMALSENIPYAEPIPLRLSIRNDGAKPIIFVRPQGLSFRNDMSIKPNSLIIDLRSISGEVIELEEFSTGFPLARHAPPTKQFSMLPPGTSCSIDVPLVWDKMNSPLAAPIPVGSYQAKAKLYLWDPGPEALDNASGYVDIGAWVGTTNYSNMSAFTILPPVQ